MPFSFQIINYAIVGGAPTITMTVSDDGINYTNYNSNTTLIDITDTDNNAFIYSLTSPWEYIKLTYVSNGATGSFSVIINM